MSERYWITADRKKIALPDMEASHLYNAFNMMLNRLENHQTQRKTMIENLPEDMKLHYKDSLTELKAIPVSGSTEIHRISINDLNKNLHAIKLARNWLDAFWAELIRRDFKV